ncbi:MAG: hypothetical protein FGM15_01275 [Chthoniobacterales bacterium]|nr:hypothetical protein [Chthoniobacterales bacterium]
MVISGMIGHKSDVRALVLRDYPLLENQKRRGMARLLLVSTIGGYQTKVTIGGESIGNLQPGLPRELFITPGEKEIKMFFQDKKFGDRDLHTLSGLAAKPGENCNVIFFDSPQTPGRPNVLAINADQQRNELLESLKPETQSLPKK